MKQALAVLAVLCVASLATAGDVTYVAAPGSELINTPMPLQAWQFKPAQDAGTTWSDAQVAPVMAMSNQPSSIQVALDADAADAKDPTVVRFNFDGKATFGKELSLPLRVIQNQQKIWTASFGPKVMDVKHGDKTVPVWIVGNCFKTPVNQNGKNVQNYRVSVTVISAIQADVKFGDKTYPVRLVDANGNFKYADPAKPIVANNMAYVAPGDGLVIDTGDGKFRKDLERCLSGQPVRVDGKWYKVALSADGTSVSADPLEATAMSSLKIAADKWTCRLVSKDMILTMHGGKDPVDVPAGDYFVQEYTVTGPTEAAVKGLTPTIVGGAQPMPNNQQVKAVAFEAGKTVDLLVGAPLKASVYSVAANGNVVFSLVFSDSGGHKVTSLIGNQGRPPAPKFSVVDSDGKAVFESTLEYG